MTQNDLMNEVQEIIERFISEGKSIAASWVVQAIVKSHPDVSGADANWYILCGYEHARDSVRQVLRRYKPSEEGPQEQVVLPGFERLQKAYLVDRGNEQTIVPVQDLTDAEIEAKEIELEIMGRGCYQHRDELKRYRMQRNSQVG